jgi:RNA polymerase sigma-70 factor (ECF subfamily)
MRDGSDRVERLYEVDAARMWRSVLGFTGNREIASDSVAEAFALALRYERSVRDLRAWTWTVAFRLAAAEARRQRQSLAAEPVSDRSLDDVPDLVRALAQLPTNQRLAIVLHDYADRPTDEVAQLLGCASATVHVHLSRGRKRLRELLEVDHA